MARRRFESIGLDGVVAKRLDRPYRARPARRGREGQAGEDRGLCRRRDPLEVAAGPIATLLLGLYDDDGGLDYVGSAAVAPARHDEIAAAVMPLLEDAPERRFSEPNRWGSGELEEQAVRPELVVEVRYDKVQGKRFRHGTKLLRLRPDKSPKQCTWREVRPPARAGRPDARSPARRRERHAAADARPARAYGTTSSAWTTAFAAGPDRAPARRTTGRCRA